jgi:glycosyltransferase involved in cell wall biosynthesis
MLPVSALIICRNEEAVIARALGSLTWADEIIVVDALSSDRTKEICCNPQAPWAAKLRWIEQPWLGFAKQRNFALNEARHDWIFFLDADECCSPELIKKINEFRTQAGGPPHHAFNIRRVEYFLGKQIHWGIWNPSYQDRFYFRHGVHYENEVHEVLKMPAPSVFLEEPILHDPNFGVSKFLHKMNIYTSIQAKQDYENGKRTHALRLVVECPAMFWKNYFYYKSYRDGVHGVVISLLEGISRTVRHIKIWQFQKQLADGTQR